MLELFPDLLESLPLGVRELAKPGLVPPAGHNSVTEVAQGDDVVRLIASALSAGHNVMGMQDTKGISLPVSADLTSIAISSFNEARQSLPVPAGVITRSH